MEKIFYTQRSCYPTSEHAVKKVLSEYFGIADVSIFKTPNGKPYLLNKQLFFSVSHTETMLFLAFSDKEIGLDAEREQRKINYSRILKNFSSEEALEIRSTQDFLKHWVAKESAIKHIGGTLANDFKNTAYIQKRIFFNGEQLPFTLSELTFDGHFLAVCCENDFKTAEFLPI